MARYRHWRRTVFSEKAYFQLDYEKNMREIPSTEKI